MESGHKKLLKSLSVALRHLLDGHYDPQGTWHPGDLEARLNALGVCVPAHDVSGVIYGHGHCLARVRDIDWREPAVPQEVAVEDLRAVVEISHDVARVVDA